MQRHEFVPSDEDENLCDECTRIIESHALEVTGIYAEDEVYGEAFDTSRYAALLGD